MVGAWDELEILATLQPESHQTAAVVLAHVLLAMRSDAPNLIADALSKARLVLGVPITAAGAKGYRHSYDAVLNLHLTHELETIYEAMARIPKLSLIEPTSTTMSRTKDLSEKLSIRFNATLPTLKTREVILSMRRTAFSLRSAYAKTFFLCLIAWMNFKRRKHDFRWSHWSFLAS